MFQIIRHNFKNSINIITSTNIIDYFMKNIIIFNCIANLLNMI